LQTTLPGTASLRSWEELKPEAFEQKAAAIGDQPSSLSTLKTHLLRCHIYFQMNENTPRVAYVTASHHFWSAYKEGRSTCQPCWQIINYANGLASPEQIRARIWRAKELKAVYDKFDPGRRKSLLHLRIGGTKKQ